jgi:hypothetical protein
MEQHSIRIKLCYRSLDALDLRRVSRRTQCLPVALNLFVYFYARLAHAVMSSISLHNKADRWLWFQKEPNEPGRAKTATRCGQLVRSAITYRDRLLLCRAGHSQNGLRQRQRAAQDRAIPRELRAARPRAARIASSLVFGGARGLAILRFLREFLRLLVEKFGASQRRPGEGLSSRKIRRSALLAHI